MKTSISKRLVSLAGLVCVALLLSACFGAKTPQEVAGAFWESVVGNDAEGAVEYSTLTDVSQYNGFSRDWSGLKPEWGRVVIDGEQASIVTTFTNPSNASVPPAQFVTFLVREDDKWKVDYARTGESLGGPFAQIFGTLGRLGKQLSDQLDTASSDLAVEMQRLGEQARQLSATAGQQASESVKKYAELLRQRIDELAESAKRALDGEGKNLSDHDRRVLREAIDNLDQDSEKLSEPTAENIAESSRSVAETRRQLGSINAEGIQQYEDEWQDWAEKIESDLRGLVEELSAAQNGRPAGAI